MSPATPSSVEDGPRGVSQSLLEDSRVIDRIVQRMGGARRLLFITGAGMSADSGLPTYRGRDGIYRAQQATPHGPSIEQALSGSMFEERPEVTWHYLLELEKSGRGAGPNRGHRVLAEMEDYFESIWILTQNVDSLHQRAGSRNVLDIHGSLHDLICPECGRHRVVPDFEDLDLPPRCPDCRAIVRPRVVLFGEDLPYDKLARLWQELRDGFDLVFSIGTSSLFDYIVEPIRRARQRGIPTVEINPEMTTVTPLVDYKVRTGAAAALDQIWERYLAFWPWS
ncbi:NAD-dependent protein deacylase [Aquisphaera giovannonii]|uniref:protein acetyllysine N-acetyltransferase n=1 Tax=Aquisphaera giovannonii TaxID=406548 RepID=A0A5B9W6L8_9BACT|nr:NAD-dependent protein deacylase [Aquisphaera giovannonii]QEH36188.1 NAD-dependent protein deacylase [Aquisphaera giovannonii]